MYQMKLLVVDDEEPLRLLFRQRLSEAGHEVALAADGGEAIQMIRSARFDVVITDLKMPVLDGLGVLSAVKEEHADTDVIIMTAYASVDSAIDAMRKGATDYLCKPFEFDELYLRLEKIAEKRELARAFSSVEQNKDYGISDLKDIAMDLHQKCLKAEKVLRGKDLDAEERIRRALKILAS